MGTAAVACLIGQLEGTLSAGERDSEDARERFVRQAGRDLDRAYRLAGLLLGDRHDAEDATQEALLRAWRGLPMLRDPAIFQAWFDRILVNICRDRLRRKTVVRFVEIVDEEAGPPIADPFRSVLDRDESLRALRVLDADERVVVVLHYWADLPLTEVATRAGIPLGTVKSRLHRALGKLERSMTAETGGRR